MIVGKALFAQLSADSAVGSFVGAGAAARIFPQEQPEKGRTYPAIIYTGEDAEADRTYTGLSGIITQKMRIVCQALTYSAMDQLAQAVFNSLSEGTGTWGGVYIEGCFYKGESEPDPLPVEGLGPDALLYQRELDFSIVFDLP